MRTIETTLYQFDELSDKAKAKALDKCREWNVDYDWWEYLYENFTQDVAQYGYSVGVKDISFSGFWSQGDGAKFSGHVSKDHNQCLGLLPCDLATRVRDYNAKCRLLGVQEITLEFSSRITSSGHYCHSGYMRLDCPTFGWEDWEDFDRVDIGMQSEFHDLTDALRDCDEIDRAVIEEARGHADDLYRALRDEYEWLTSDEQVAESIRCNEREFTEEGELA